MKREPWTTEFNQEMRQADTRTVRDCGERQAAPSDTAQKAAIAVEWAER